MPLRSAILSHQINLFYAGAARNSWRPAVEECHGSTCGCFAIFLRIVFTFLQFVFTTWQQVGSETSIWNCLRMVRRSQDHQQVAGEPEERPVAEQESWLMGVAVS